MKEEERMLVERFYQKCGELLGMTYTAGAPQKLGLYRDGSQRQSTNASRWGGREPGSGRFPGYGIIRVFGNKVHVALHTPDTVTKWFDSHMEVLTFLATLSR